MAQQVRVVEIEFLIPGVLAFVTCSGKEGLLALGVTCMELQGFWKVSFFFF